MRSSELWEAESSELWEGGGVTGVMESSPQAEIINRPHRAEPSAAADNLNGVFAADGLSIFMTTPSRFLSKTRSYRFPEDQNCFPIRVLVNLDCTVLIA